MENNNYFYAKDVNIRTRLSQCDVDILLYAINHVDWSEYNAEDYGGESDLAACEHLDDFEYMIANIL